MELDLPDLDAMFIVPAERMIAEACNLRLNTDNYPSDWAGRFEDEVRGPRLVSQYESDYKSAIYIVVNQLAMNPSLDSVTRIGNASTIFSNARVPPQAMAVMRRWTSPLRVYRA
jgi:hypothetical protein